jgi:hypothetical protein
MKQVPIVRLSDLSPAERKAYVLADNKLALNGGWDREVLAIELQGLIDLGFDIEATGFAVRDRSHIGRGGGGRSQRSVGWPAEDEIPIVRDAAVSPAMCGGRRRHRLVCGDARDKDAYAALLGDERADLIFTDPPTMFPSMATSVARAAFNPGNSRWASERRPQQCRLANDRQRRLPNIRQGEGLFWHPADGSAAVRTLQKITASLRDGKNTERGHTPWRYVEERLSEMHLTCQGCDRVTEFEETKPWHQTRAAQTLGADWAIGLSTTALCVTSHECGLFRCSRSNASRSINCPFGPSMI